MDELNTQNISSEKSKKTRAKKPKVLPQLSVEIPEQSAPVIPPSPPSPEPSVAIQAPKPKRVVSEKTKLALAEGRAKLRELKEKQRQDRSLLIDTKINQKAERIAIQKMKLIKDLGLDDTSKDIEEPDITHMITNKARKVLETLPLPVKKTPVVKKKLPPKVIYVSDEEEEEEEPEVVYKIKHKGKAPTPAPGFGGIQFY